jgi:hypothetical protein
MTPEPVRGPTCTVAFLASSLAGALLSNWHGRPVFLEGRRTRRVSYTEILRAINEGRDERDRITYDSLWVHAKRHHDLDGIVDYWTARLYRELRTALEGRRTAGPIE